MFSKLTVISFLALLPILAVATPNNTPTTTPIATTTVTITQTATSTPISQCNTGPIQCCQSVSTQSQNSTLTTILSLLGIVLQDLDVPIGLTCDPITVVGAGGTSCTAQPVCCENNTFNGLIALGCVPISIGL